MAIIMDGNGRWAKLKGKPRVFGHRNGVKSVREVTEAAAELGIDYLTLYAFSTENWNRPRFEIDALMALLVKSIQSEIKTLQKNNIRLQTIGDLEGLPEASRKALQEGIYSTRNNTRMTLILALNYSARWDILQAVQRIGVEIEAGKLRAKSIDQSVIDTRLSTNAIPDPALLIRTSGEYRISNFLLWQIAYTELYFTEVLWPDFGKQHFYEAILNFQQRERRFGKTSEQVAI